VNFQFCILIDPDVSLASRLLQIKKTSCQVLDLTQSARDEAEKGSDPPNNPTTQQLFFDYI